ncbi:MAG: glycosyltransferase family 4 protein [Phototrophicaceae bacterium]|jgi:glycosyltransferase involved in cell wall biosynthesis
MMHIGLNAHLLSPRAGYRAAGIHGYMFNTLVRLPAAAPADWRFTVMVGASNPLELPPMQVRRAGMNTESPLRRVIWEQMIQPFVVRDFDLLHALAFVAPVLPVPPYVVTIYDLSFIHYPSVLSASRRAYLRAFTAHTCRHATRVIAISQSTARDVIATFDIDPARVDVAPGGTDFSVFRPLPAEQVSAFRLAQGLPDVFWLFIGTLEPRKNLPTLLRAYATLPPTERPPLVIGGGKGWDYAEIFQTVAAYNLTNDVRFVGFIPTEDLALWYNSASTFVYPSVYEGFGLPVLEAMACGTPVIAADTSSLPEVVGGSVGMLVAPHDVEAWAAALIRARDDAAWRQQARNSGLIAAQRYTWENTAQQTVNSYKNSQLQ